MGQQWHQALPLLAAMQAAAIPLHVFTYDAAIRACEKAQQWHRASGLLATMRKVDAVPNVTTYKVAVSACQQAQLWHRALGLPAAMQALDSVPFAITYPLASVLATRPNKGTKHSTSGADACGSFAPRCHHLLCRHQRLREDPTMAPGTQPSGAVACGSPSPRCHHLQRCHQCLRERSAIAPGSQPSGGDVAGSFAARTNHTLLPPPPSPTNTVLRLARQAPTPGVPWRRPRGHDDERAQRKPEPIMHAMCRNGAGNVAPRSCCGTPSQGAGHNQFPPGPPR